MARVAAALVVSVITAGVLAGCGSSGGPQAVPSRAPATRRPTSRPVATATVSPPTVRPSASGFPVDYVVPCAGQPTADQVVALLRAGKVLPVGATVTTINGPLCSGSWQYTALDVAGLGPLQAVTEGAGSALRLVTAGTDVCTPAVTGQAPAGVRAVARCA
jgi:hypothetical protein